MRTATTGAVMVKIFKKAEKGVVKNRVFHLRAYGGIFAIFLFAVLSVGCDMKPIFSKTIDYSLVGAAPKSAKITGDEYGAVKIKNDPAASIEIKVAKIRASCSTERARSLGSDFDGYILFDVYKDGKLAAKAQMDFKTEPTKKDYEKVWGELAHTLGWGG